MSRDSFVQSRRSWLALLAVVALAASLLPVLAGPAGAAGTFTDDDGSVHEPNIEFIAARGITAGCSTSNPDLYCPNNLVTRGQMASFIARALGLPAAGTDYFSDDNGSVHEDNINRIAAAGITSGFPDGTYRPNDSVSRGQMASFIARGFNLPPAATDFFTDDNGSVHEANINRIAAAGITTGFSDGTYRPGDSVTRGQMASFIARAIQYTTTGTTSTTQATTSTTTPGSTTTSTTVPPAQEYALRVSTSADRSGSVLLNGDTVSGNIYVFVPQAVGDPVTQVRFWIDDATRSGDPYRVENISLFDLEATAGNGNANPFDTFRLSNGSHRVDVEIDLASGSTITRSSTFTVSNSSGVLLDKYEETFRLQPNTSSGSPKSVVVDTNDGSAGSWTAAKSGGVPSDTSWLTLDNASGNFGQAVTLSASASGLSPGVREAFVTVSSSGKKGATFTVTLTVLPTGGVCPALNAAPVGISAPFTLGFGAAAASTVQDQDAEGTGFRCVLATSNGAGYLNDRIDLDTNNAVLSITSTAGLAIDNVDTQDNALGVGWATGASTVTLSTTMISPPSGSGGFQQAGLWFGTNEDNYVKLVVVNGTGGLSGTRVQLYEEAGGANGGSSASADVGSLSGQTLTLTLTLDSTTNQASATYRIGGGVAVGLGTVNIAPGLFAGADHDASGATPNLQLGGVFTSHRSGPAALTYTFDSFSVVTG